MKKSILSSSIATTCLLIQTSASAETTISNLGVIGPVYSDSISLACGVSRDGTTVIGNSGKPSNLYNGFKWTAQAGLQAIEMPNGSSQTIAVSADGQSILAYSGNNWFRLTSSGQIQNIGPDNHGNSISGDGSTIVGATSTGLPFFWTITGGAQVLNLSPDCRTSGACATNFDGSIIAGSIIWNSGGCNAFRWSQSNGLQLLGFNGSSNAISGDGSTIVGRQYDSIQFHACSWDSNGVQKDLGRLQTEAVATSLTDTGKIIVGYNSDYGGSNKNAFLWTADLGMVNLHDYLASTGVDMSHWTQLLKVSISGDGSTLAGSGFYEGGQERAFIITGLNIPSPAASALLALAGFVSRRRRA